MPEHHYHIPVWARGEGMQRIASSSCRVARKSEKHIQSLRIISLRGVSLHAKHLCLAQYTPPTHNSHIPTPLLLAQVHIMQSSGCVSEFYHSMAWIRLQNSYLCQCKTFRKMYFNANTPRKSSQILHTIPVNTLNQAINSAMCHTFPMRPIRPMWIGYFPPTSNVRTFSSGNRSN